MPRRRHGVPEPNLELARRRRIVVVGEEPVEWNRNAWILPRRGGVEFLSLLDQALDGVNVVALDITIGETQLVEVRRLDKRIGHRIGSMVRRAAMETSDGTLKVPLRIALVIG